MLVHSFSLPPAIDPLYSQSRSQFISLSESDQQSLSLPFLFFTCMHASVKGCVTYACLLMRLAKVVGKEVWAACLCYLRGCLPLFLRLGEAHASAHAHAHTHAYIYSARVHLSMHDAL